LFKKKAFTLNTKDSKIQTFELVSLHIKDTHARAEEQHKRDDKGDKNDDGR
jgi:hypothetical protein